MVLSNQDTGRENFRSKLGWRPALLEHKLRKESIMKNITVDVMKNTLVVTKAFYKKACVFGSEEFKELHEAMAACPGYTVEFKMQNKARKTYKRLTIARMEEYINTQSNSEARAKEFSAVMEVAKAKGSLYPAAKKWFLANYPEFKVGDVSEDETASLLNKVVKIPADEAKAYASNF